MQVVAPPLTVSGCQNETISAIIAAWSNSGSNIRFSDRLAVVMWKEAEVQDLSNVDQFLVPTSRIFSKLFEAGVYMPDSLNHGKVVYKKREKSRGHHAVDMAALFYLIPRRMLSGLDVLIYFWDERDGSRRSVDDCSRQVLLTSFGLGPELCGWWFGPNVGGDQALTQKC